MRIALFGTDDQRELLTVRQDVLNDNPGSATFMCATVPINPTRLESFMPDLLVLFDTSAESRNRRQLIELGFSLRPQLSRITYVVFIGTRPSAGWEEASFAARMVPRSELVEFIVSLLPVRTD